MPGADYLYITGVADPGTGAADTFFFARDELEALVADGGLRNAQVWFEHGDQWKTNMGEVAYAWVEPRQGLKVVIRIDRSQLCAASLFEWVKDGIFRGLSLGYTAALDPVTFKATGKTVQEISVVKHPFHPSCVIDGVFEQCEGRTHFFRRHGVR